MLAAATLPYCVVDASAAFSPMQAEHRAQILEIEQQQPLVVGDAERDVEHAFLRVVEIEQPREQERPHLRHGRAHRMPFFAEQVPEHRRRTRPAGRHSPISFARLTNGSFASPAAATPERSPLMSAANTGTPARANPSASTCSVTVLPVPVAPVTRP